MREYAAEKKRARGKSKDPRAEGEAALLAAVKAMKEPDRSMAERIHAIVTATAPDLIPKTWYGMPAWARDDKAVCFFQSSQKFKTRYSTLGFSDKANLDDGAMWPVAYSLTKLTGAVEKEIAALVKKAAG
jgi:uncharacterized protein YdhG (YjbR/CyaY superfamily)